MSEPPEGMSAEAPTSSDAARARTGAEPASRSTEPERASGGTAPAACRRRLAAATGALAFIAGGVVVVIIAIVILVLALGGGDGTKQTANPLEVRQLVATFHCTPNNPGTPSAIKVTAGQEVVQLGRGGCAVVGTGDRQRSTGPPR